MTCLLTELQKSNYFLLSTVRMKCWDYKLDRWDWWWRRPWAGCSDGDTGAGDYEGSDGAGHYEGIYSTVFTNICVYNHQ